MARTKLSEIPQPSHAEFERVLRSLGLPLHDSVQSLRRYLPVALARFVENWCDELEFGLPPDKRTTSLKFPDEYLEWSIVDDSQGGHPGKRATKRKAPAQPKVVQPPRKRGRPPSAASCRKGSETPLTVADKADGMMEHEMSPLTSLSELSSLVSERERSMSEASLLLAINGVKDEEEGEHDQHQAQAGSSRDLLSGTVPSNSQPDVSDSDANEPVTRRGTRRRPVPPPKRPPKKQSMAVFVPTAVLQQQQEEEEQEHEQADESTNGGLAQEPDKQAPLSPIASPQDMDDLLSSGTRSRQFFAVEISRSSSDSP